MIFANQKSPVRNCGTLDKEGASQRVVVHMKEARILSIQVGLPKTIARTEKTEIIDKTWTSGIFKAAVSGRVWLSKLNLEGDAQANIKAHGGPHRAVNVYPSEHYPYWKQDLHLSDSPTEVSERILQRKGC